MHSLDNGHKFLIALRHKLIKKLCRVQCILKVRGFTVETKEKKPVACGTRKRVGGVMRTSWTAALISMLFLSMTAIAAAANMSSTQVLAEGCATTPDNFVLSDFWDNEMGVLEAWCDYPSIS